MPTSKKQMALLLPEEAVVIFRVPEKKIIYYNNNMEEKNKLIRELLSGKTIEDLQTLVNFKRQMKKPKSTVKRILSKSLYP